MTTLGIEIPEEDLNHFAQGYDPIQSVTKEDAKQLLAFIREVIKGIFMICLQNLPVGAQIQSDKKGGVARSRISSRTPVEVKA